MYTFNKQVRQDARIVEKCCLGNGQLSCIVGRAQQLDKASVSDPEQLNPFDRAAKDGVN